MVNVSHDIIVRQVYHAIHAATHEQGVGSRRVVVESAMWNAVPEHLRQRIRKYAHNQDVPLFINPMEELSDSSR